MRTSCSNGSSWIPFRSRFESEFCYNRFVTEIVGVACAPSRSHIILMSCCYPKITKNDFHFTKLPITKRQLVGQWIGGQLCDVLLFMSSGSAGGVSHRKQRPATAADQHRVFVWIWRGSRTSSAVYTVWQHAQLQHQTSSDDVKVCRSDQYGLPDFLPEMEATKPVSANHADQHFMIDAKLDFLTSLLF